MLLFRNILSESSLSLSRGATISATCVRHFAKKSGENPCKKKGKAVDVCVDDHPKPRSAKDIEKSFPFYHLIKYKMDCCLNDCVENDFPNFDKCFYKETDKNKRKYQITWVECPRMKIKPKKICCFENAKNPPIIRRKLEDKPDTACKKQECPPAASKCPRVRMSRCRTARVPPKCYVMRLPSDCVKVKAPYPSYSECSRNKLRRKRKTECECLDQIMMCEVYKQLNKKLRHGNFSLNPCDRRRNT